MVIVHENSEVPYVSSPLFKQRSLQPYRETPHTELTERSVSYGEDTELLMTQPLLPKTPTAPADEISTELRGLRTRKPWTSVKNFAVHICRTVVFLYWNRAVSSNGLSTLLRSSVLLLGVLLMCLSYAADSIALQHCWSPSWMVTSSLLMQLGYIYVANCQPVFSINNVAQRVLRPKLFRPSGASRLHCELSSFEDPLLQSRSSVSSGWPERLPGTPRADRSQSDIRILEPGTDVEEIWLHASCASPVHFYFELVDVALPVAFLFLLAQIVPLQLLKRCSNHSSSDVLAVLFLVLTGQSVMAAQCWKLLSEPRYDRHQEDENPMFPRPQPSDLHATKAEKPCRRLQSEEKDSGCLSQTPPVPRRHNATHSSVHLAGVSQQDDSPQPPTDEKNTFLPRARFSVNLHADPLASFSTSNMTVLASPMSGDDIVNFFPSATMTQLDDIHQRQLFGDVTAAGPDCSQYAFGASPRLMYLAGFTSITPISSLSCALLDLACEFKRHTQDFLDTLARAPERPQIVSFAFAFALLPFMDYSKVHMVLISVYAIVHIALILTIRGRAFRLIWQRQPVLLEYNLLLVQLALSSIFLLLSLQKIIFESLAIPESLLWKLGSPRSAYHAKQFGSLLASGGLRVGINVVNRKILSTFGLATVQWVELVSGMLWYFLVKLFSSKWMFLRPFPLAYPIAILDIQAKSLMGFRFLLSIIVLGLLAFGLQHHIALRDSESRRTSLQAHTNATGRNCQSRKYQANKVEHRASVPGYGFSFSGSRSYATGSNAPRRSAEDAKLRPFQRNAHVPKAKNMFTWASSELDYTEMRNFLADEIDHLTLSGSAKRKLPISRRHSSVLLSSDLNNSIPPGDPSSTSLHRSTASISKSYSFEIADADGSFPLKSTMDTEFSVNDTAGSHHAPNLQRIIPKLRFTEDDLRRPAPETSSALVLASRRPPLPMFCDSTSSDLRSSNGPHLPFTQGHSSLQPSTSVNQVPSLPDSIRPFRRLR